MYTPQTPENLCASTDMDMDADRTWEDWINLDACTPEVDISPVFGNEYQYDSLNYDYPEFGTHTQDATDVSVCPVPTMEYPVSWDPFFSTSQGFTFSMSSPISSSSLSSISTSSSRSPSLSPQSARNFDVDELVSVNTTTDVTSPSPSRSSPPPTQPISKSLRSPKRSSSRRAVPYEVPSPKTPSPVRVIRYETPCRSLRPRGAQKYREPTPSLSEDDDDTPYTSDDDFGYSPSPKRRGAPSIQPHARILHQIQRDTSLTSCPICANEFSRHADVIRHYLSVHHIKSDAEILNDTSSKRLHCLGCTKILSRKDSRERHEAICPVYCAQRGTVPNPIRTVQNPESI